MRHPDKAVYRKRCWTCRYAPGGYPWYNPREAKLWCGVGRALVDREDGEYCSSWKLMNSPPKCAEKNDATA